MQLPFAVVFTAVGLLLLTPAGASRMKELGDRHGRTPGTAKSVAGLRITGVLFTAVGLYLIVRAV